MGTEQLKDIEDYEAYLGESLEAWSPRQRLALAAAMAERWLPVYEAFAAKEKWGDPANLRRSLGAVWGQVSGAPLAPAERARMMAQLDDSTPHMDDFDAPEALAACVILHEAVECSAAENNAAAAVRAALSGFEAAVPEWQEEPELQPRLWRQVAARGELKKQLRLVERIGAMTRFDEAAVEALRRELAKPDAAGKVLAPKKTGPAPMTNQVAFEQYRRLLESQLRRPPAASAQAEAWVAATMVFAEWGSRYCQRVRALSGKHGKIGDEAALAALTARQHALDTTAPEMPIWHPMATKIIQLGLANPLGEYDAKSIEGLHGYGPSLRRLWAEAKSRGADETRAWAAIREWARHRPAGWEAEDKRKKKGTAYSALALGEHLARAITWTSSGDVFHPWAAEVDGQRWRVRLNDFPDDIMYTLVVGDAEIGGFHDWPVAWQRP